MKSTPILLILCISCFLLNCKSENTAPVTPDAIPAARNLLNTLYTIKGEKTLSGQHNYGHEVTRSTDSIFNVTGEYPAIWGDDFLAHQQDVREKLFNEAVRQHQNGSIITLMYHQGRPYADSIGGFRDEMTDEDWQQLVIPGTPIHNTWLADIDAVAIELKRLEKEGIPVLWRPYHEMNGTWFWWCNRQGEDGIKKLWKIMFERYVNHHQLKNLIWVWNANGPRDWENDEAYAYDLFFPGLDYVDVLATDIYKGDYKQSHHDDLLALANGKPIALGEVGKLPEPDIFETQPQWTWFMIWARFNWTANTDEEIKAFYSLPRILSREDLKNISTE